ncbi:MAG: glycosyltransferase family 25 protein [Hyphomicrobiales bacterium]|nr:glycosyltransferase family 25 protein [Hyphomicrobiales bacterium]
MLPTALVINLDRETDRYAHISREADRVGLSVERIPGVDGLNVPAHLRPKFFAQSATVPASLLMPGEVGCYASHLLAYEHILEQGLDWALILEDDVRLSDDLVATVRDTFNRLPSGWDIVRLSSQPRRSVLIVDTLQTGRHLVRYSKLPKQAGAQLVSASGARKLLQPGLRVRPIDADLRHGYLFDLDMYGVYPTPVRHSGLFRSSIKFGPGSRRLLRGGRWQAPRWSQRLLASKQAWQTLRPRGIAICAMQDVSLWAQSRRWPVGTRLSHHRARLNMLAQHRM